MMKTSNSDRTTTDAQYAAASLDMRLRVLPRYRRRLRKSYAGRMLGLSLIQITSYLHG